MSVRKIAAARNKRHQREKAQQNEHPEQKQETTEQDETKQSIPPSPEGDQNQSSTSMASNLLENSERREKCCRLIEEFMQSLGEVFPECKEIERQLSEFRNNVLTSPRLQNMLIKQWHQVMRPLYALADAHDQTFWARTTDLPYFGKIGLQAKFNDPQLDQESHETMWEFMDRINRLTRIYNAVPVNMLKQLETAATSMIQRVQNGGNPANWDYNEIRDMGRDVMQRINQEEVTEFFDNIKGLVRGVNLENATPANIPQMVAQMPLLSEFMGDTSEVSNILNQVFAGDGLNNVMQNIQQLMTAQQQQPQPPSQ